MESQDSFDLAKLRAVQQRYVSSTQSTQETYLSVPVASSSSSAMSQKGLALRVGRLRISSRQSTELRLSVGTRLTAVNEHTEESTVVQESGAGNPFEGDSPLPISEDLKHGRQASVWSEIEAVIRTKQQGAAQVQSAVLAAESEDQQEDDDVHYCSDQENETEPAPPVEYGPSDSLLESKSSLQAAHIMHLAGESLTPASTTSADSAPPVVGTEFSEPDPSYYTTVALQHPIKRIALIKKNARKNTFKPAKGRSRSMQIPLGIAAFTAGAGNTDGAEATAAVQSADATEMQCDQDQVSACASNPFESNSPVPVAVQQQQQPPSMRVAFGEIPLECLYSSSALNSPAYEVMILSSASNPQDCSTIRQGVLCAVSHAGYDPDGLTATVYAFQVSYSPVSCSVQNSPAASPQAATSTSTTGFTPSKLDPSAVVPSSRAKRTLFGYQRQEHQG